jgi:hypothetical protein
MLWRLSQLKDSIVLCQNERRFVGAPVSHLKFKKVGFVLGACRGQVAASTDSVNRAVRVYAVRETGRNPEAAPQLPASVPPRVLAEPHQFTAPYTPRSAGSLLDLGIPEKTKPTARRYGVKTGTDQGAK